MSADSLSLKLIGKLSSSFLTPESIWSVPHQYRGNSSLLERRKFEKQNKAGPRIGNGAESDPDDDNDTCEEWERHEALNNDVQANRTNHDQVQSSSSYLAESGDLEQQVLKKKHLKRKLSRYFGRRGRSGLNFYTDAQFLEVFGGRFWWKNYGWLGCWYVCHYEGKARPMTRMLWTPHWRWGGLTSEEENMRNLCLRKGEKAEEAKKNLVWSRWSNRIFEVFQRVQK